MNIPEENNQRRENIQVGNIGFYIPFVEKLKLYQTFFTKGLLWTKNKNQLWKHEKAILEWAWSPTHQHLARNLTSTRLLEAYGITRVKNDSGIEFLQNRPVEIICKNKDELINEMFSDRGGILEPIMGNLVIKGLAQAITYSDLTGDRSISAVHSVIINNQGLLTGEIAHEEQINKLWKYKITLLFLYHLLFLSLLAAVFLVLNQVFGIKPVVEINTFLAIITKTNSSILIVIFIVLYFLLIWTKL